jgi:tripartite-type tricarboxylate transporter receptor subunit TctC
MVFVASSKAPFGTMKELFDTAKAQSDGISWASSGRATLNHIAGEWLAADAGIKLFHIPYKGAAAAGTAVLTGEVPLGVITLVQALPLVKSGRLRALAVTTAQRSALAPDWPTVAESGIPGFDAAVDIALFAPRGTPRAIVSAIYADTLQVLRLPETEKRFSGMGVEIAIATPEELATLIRTGRARIQSIVDRAGITVE